MTRRMIPRVFPMAAAWLSLGMVLSASSCDQSDPSSLYSMADMQQLERWNAERMNELAQKAMIAAINSPSGQLAMSKAEHEWLQQHAGRTDCPGNSCDKKKDDISTP